MAITPRIVLLSNQRDVSLDWVVTKLRQREAPFLRINSERLADEFWSIRSGGDWTLRTRREVYSLRHLQAILYRRPEPTRVRGVVAPERK